MRKAAARSGRSVADLIEKRFAGRCSGHLPTGQSHYGTRAEADIRRPRQRPRRRLMRQGEAAFVDSGAWIALALSRDPLHTRAREHWEMLEEAGARLHTSVPVILETFTFLSATPQRRGIGLEGILISRAVPVKVLPCEQRDLASHGTIFDARTFTGCSAVDATSFAIMTRARIRVAFTFDHHFAAVGFRLVG